MSYKIICGDNVNILETYSENHFDCCITDPPYGMGMEEWDHSVPPKESWESVYRVLKPGAFLISFCSPQLYHRMVSAVEDANFMIQDQVIWMITTKMAKANRLKPAHEPIVIAQKPYEKSLKHNHDKWGVGKINLEDTRVPWDGEPPKGWIKGGANRRAFGKEVNKASEQKVKEKEDANPEGRYPSNIIGHFDNPNHQKYFYAPRVTRKERGEYNDHPTPKPISLMEYLIKVYCPKEGSVLDPYNGSGSTGIASINLNNHFTGIDTSQHYCDIAIKRIEDYSNQGKLNL